MQVENIRIVKEDGIPVEEMEKHLREFLRRKYVREELSKDNYTKLKRLTKSLKEMGCGQKSLEEH